MLLFVFISWIQRVPNRQTSAHFGTRRYRWPQTNFEDVFLRESPLRDRGREAKAMGVGSSKTPQSGFKSQFNSSASNEKKRRTTTVYITHLPSLVSSNSHNRTGINSQAGPWYLSPRMRRIRQVDFFSGIKTNDRVSEPEPTEVIPQEGIHQSQSQKQSKYLCQKQFQHKLSQTLPGGIKNGERSIWKFEIYIFYVCVIIVKAS